MKKNILFIAFSIISSASFSQGSWIAKANLGTATNGRSKGAAFVINGLGYIGTGYNGTAKNDFWQYDPMANVWTQKANFGGSARYGAIGFAVNGDGYIGTGFASPNFMKDMWKYNVSGNSWTQVGDFGGSGRMDATCFVIGNRVYAGTGQTSSNVLNDFWQYNPGSDTWTSKANFGGTARSNATGFAVGGKGYVCLGRNFNSGTYYNNIFQYDTTANTWTARANFTGAAREGASAFVIGNYAYVGTGGSNNLGTLYNDFYKYDPAGNAWSAIATFIGSLRSHSNGFSIGNFGYVGMGYTGGQVNSFYQYDMCSITNTVTPTNVSCNGGSNGSVNLTVSGATSPLTYLWSNASTSEDISGLSAGSYSVLITDANTCTSTNTVAITAPVAISNTVTLTHLQCFGDSSGSVDLTVSGGISAYTYLWSNNATTQDVSGLDAGSYNVLITDANGCKDTAFAILTQPTALAYSVTSSPASCSTCADGGASATVSGGTSPYTYAWTPSGKTTQSVTGLLPGQYTVCITDSSGCSACDTVSIGTNSGIAEYNSPAISIFPNPSSGMFKVQGLKANANLFIYNCIGEMVYSVAIPRKDELINASSLPFGIYFLKIETEDKIYTKKLTLTE